MSKKRNADNGDRIDESGSYIGPSIMAIAVTFLQQLTASWRAERSGLLGCHRRGCCIGAEAQWLVLAPSKEWIFD